jgi:outer membrane immunogenic protein
MKKFAAAIVSAAALVAPAMAQSADETRPISTGIGYTYYDADGVEFNALSLRAGYDFLPFLGVEAEALVGLGDETFAFEDVSVDASLNYSLGVFAKATLPVLDSAGLFVRLGYVTTELEASALGESTSETDDGFAYGVGGEWMIAGPHGVRGDYTRYDFDGGEADAFSVSYVLRF